MGELIEKTVVMAAADWNDMAAEAEHKAIETLKGDQPAYGRGDRLTKAAELLRAAATFRGRANTMDNFGEGPDTAVVEAWDLSDEGVDDLDGAAWPQISAELRRVAGDNPKMLQMVEHIDRLHHLAEQKGSPVITRRELRREAAQPQ